jgi:hypothetical protein
VYYWLFIALAAVKSSYQIDIPNLILITGYSIALKVVHNYANLNRNSGAALIQSINWWNKYMIGLDRAGHNCGLCLIWSSNLQK